MKTLIAYYSLTGNTKKVAEELSTTLKADLDEIIDTKKRSGPVGFLAACKDAATKQLTDIKTKKQPQKYDLVVIGTPVWAGKMAPAIRAYLTQNKFKKVAFFCTLGSTGKPFEEMEQLSGKPVSTLTVSARELKTSWSDKLTKFIKGIE